MNVVLWILQVLLAGLFVMHGYLYIAPPPEMAPGIESMGIDPGFRVFIGVAEWLGAAGLLLPGITRVLPWLTPLAAAGLMIVMGSSVVFHLSRGEVSMAISNTVIFVLVAFVAYGRWRLRPLQARTAVAPA